MERYRVTNPSPSYIFESYFLQHLPIEKSLLADLGFYSSFLILTTVENYEIGRAGGAMFSNHHNLLFQLLDVVSTAHLD
jgi:hypothetical protein